MRKDRGAEGDAVAVHGVGAPEERDLHGHVGLHRRGVIERRLLAPLREARTPVAARLRIRTVEDAAEVVALHVVGCRLEHIGLGHLADLLRKRHARDDLFDTRLHRGIARDGARDARPVGKAVVAWRYR